MAREEAQLLCDGVKNINQKLKAILPYCTLESIKGVCRKTNKKYQDLLSEFISETRCGSKTDTSSHSNIEPSQCGAEVSSTDTRFSGREYEEWVSAMMQEIECASFYTEVEMELCHRYLTDDVRWAVDFNFQRWLEREGESELDALPPILSGDRSLMQLREGRPHIKGCRICLRRTNLIARKKYYRVHGMLRVIVVHCLSWKPFGELYLSRSLCPMNIYLI